MFTNHTSKSVSEPSLGPTCAAWTAPPRRATRGWTWLYTEHVQQADTGCDLDFLTGEKTLIDIGENWPASRGVDMVRPHFWQFAHIHEFLRAALRECRSRLDVTDWSRLPRSSAAPG